MGADIPNRLRMLWGARSGRERRFLAVGTAVLGGAALYAVVYAPVEMARTKLAERLPRLRADHRLLMAQVDEIRNRRPEAASSVKEVGELKLRVERLARAAGIRDGEFRVAPEGGDRVRFSASPRPAGSWLDWVAELQRQGLMVQSARLSMTGKEGQAQFEAVLMAGQQ